MPPNINRSNIIWIPIIFYLCFGMIILFKNYKKISNILLILYLISFSLFEIYYYTGYKKEVVEYSYYGLEESIKLANEIDYEDLYIADTINQPYIFHLFFNKIDSKYYKENRIVHSINKDGSEKILELDNVHFYRPSIVSKGDIIIINSFDDTEYPTCKKKIINDIKMYVC